MKAGVGGGGGGKEGGRIDAGTKARESKPFYARLNSHSNIFGEMTPLL